MYSFWFRPGGGKKAGDGLGMGGVWGQAGCNEGQTETLRRSWLGGSPISVGKSLSCSVLSPVSLLPDSDGKSESSRKSLSSAA
jgi:hypothetical protein